MSLPSRHRGLAAGVVLGTVYALIMAAIFTYIPGAEFLSIAILVVMPVSTGVIVLFFAEVSQANSIRYRIFAPWFSIVGWSVVSLALQAETFICVVMLAPLYFALASAGGLAGGWVRVQRNQRASQGTVSGFIVLPLLLFPIESSWQQPTEVRTVNNTIEISAPANVVWQGILEVPDISDEELQWNFAHAIGIPKPYSACVDRVAVGGIRNLRWQRGVHFQERITRLEPNKLFAYDVIVDPASMAIKELDTHVVVGDRYFNVERGHYQLDRQGDKTTLTLSTTYRITTKVNTYGIFWADWVLDDFHSAVLGVIKARVESGISRGCA